MASEAPSIAVGFFDGVHIGHQAILRNAATALTFRNHPLSVLRPESAPRLIMKFEDRVAAIRACGVREVVALDFTRELAALAPEEFAAAFLPRLAGAVKPRVFCGANWNFGRGGSADASFLRAMGYDVTVVPFAEHAGEKVSSTRIRGAIAAGDIGAASAMLGRDYVVAGRVERGKGLGREMGFPTVNVALERDGLVEPPRGVYAVTVAGARAIANYGVAPTMGDRAWERPVLEVHFLDAPYPVPENAVAVTLRRFIRPERKFESLAALKTQIARDLQIALAPSQL